MSKRSASAVAGSIAFVAAATLAFVQSLPGTRWIGVAILGLIAVVSAIGEVARFREDRRGAEAAREGTLRHRLTAIKDADPFALGVTRSAIADRYKGNAALPPYVPREIDPMLDRVLRQEPFIAVVGPSKAGKSRTAFEAVLRNFPERTLVAPRSPEREGREELFQALVDCVDSAKNKDAIIWLDDLPEFLKARAITTGDVNAWREAYPGVMVMATIRDGELAGLRGASGDGTEAEKVLEQATLVPLSPALSPREQKAAATAYPDEDFRDGLGVHLVAGQQLVERFVSAREVNPLGFAVVAAAVDRYRAGVFDSVNPKELAALAPAYYCELRPRSKFPAGEIDEALEWATGPVIQDISILLRENDGYVPFDYISAFRDGEVAGGVGKAEIPDRMWEALIERHSSWTLRAIGESAIARNRIEFAVKAFAKLAEDPDPHLAAHGTDDCGGALAMAGEVDTAISSLSKAVGSGYDCVVATASYRLALAVERADLAQAETLYRKVLEYPDSWVNPKAAVNLGLLLRLKTSIKSRQTEDGTQFVFGNEVRNETDRQLEAEAQDLFETAVDSRDREAIANGANALGALLFSKGEREEGEKALRRGIEAGSAQAAITLALMIYGIPGREAEAWQLIDRADGMAKPENTGYLNFSAGVIAVAREDHQEAVARFKLVAKEEAEGLAEAASMRAAKLLLLEIEGGEEEGLALLDGLIAKGDQIAAEASELKESYLTVLDDKSN